jgi:predicted nucleic-acid-binding protein
MRFVDANIILRYLLEDDSVLSVKAANILEHNDVHAPFEVLAEVVRKDIKQSLAPQFL